MVSKLPPVAVVGVSALFPGSPDAERFWRNIVEGVDLISEVPASHWRHRRLLRPRLRPRRDKMYATRGGFLPAVDFAPIDFGIPPNVVPATDTAQLLGLAVAKQVLEDAAGGDISPDGSRADQRDARRASGGDRDDQLTWPGRLQQPVWERGLRAAGLSEGETRRRSVSARRCRLHAVAGEHLPRTARQRGRRPHRQPLRPGRHQLRHRRGVRELPRRSSRLALNELYLGKSDMVITGGVDALNDIFMFMCFSKATALSPTGDCRPFSDQADGTMLGEGLGDGGAQAPR